MAYEGGSFKTNQYSNRGLEFAWAIHEQYISTNETKIYWRLKGVGSSSYWYESGNFLVKIDGKEVYKSETRINLDNGTMVAEGYTTIKHNVDGSRNFSAYVEAGIFYYAVNVSGSGSWDLKPIPRAATLTNAPDFNDEENPTIYFSNPAGDAVDNLKACINFDGSINVAAYRNIPDISKGSYTFQLTDEERKNLTDNITDGTTRKVRFYLATVIGGVEYVAEPIEKTASIINANPTLETTLYDTLHTDLTGSGNIIIKGFNEVYAKATAAGVKGATIKKYYIRCGDDMLTESSGRFYNVNSGEFVFTVVDSRGLSTSTTVKKELVNYFPPTCVMSSSADLDKSSEETTTAIATLSFKGSFFNSSFGKINNTITLEYQFRNTDDEYGEVWNSTNEIVSGDSYTFTIEKTNLNYQQTYSVRARYKDGLKDYIYIPEQIIKAVPVFDWGGEDFNFNVPVVSIQNKEIAYPIEKGESNGWTYVKWSNGIGECWRTLSHTTAVNTAWGSLYSGTATSRQTYPFQFASKPTEIASLTAGSYQGILFPEKDGNGENSYTTSACYNICRPSSVGSSTFYISLYVKGKI